MQSVPSCFLVHDSYVLNIVRPVGVVSAYPTWHLSFHVSTVLEQVSKLTWCLTSTETIRLIRDGDGGGYGGEGEREIIYLSLHCHHQNDFRIKMGSDESL